MFIPTKRTIHLQADVNRIFFDTEFIEDGTTIDLVSIGMVTADGREYYAVNREAPFYRANPWVQANVLPHLPPKDAPEWKDHARISEEVLEFVRASQLRPEFWAYYADYDWVVFCQLFGRMADMPKGLPWYCNDLRQLANHVGDPKLPAQQGTQHHALDDARWNREVFEHLLSVC